MSNQKILVVVALGIGAYVFMKQQAARGGSGAVRPVVTNPQTGAPAAGASGGGGLFDMVGALFAPLRNGFVGQGAAPTTQIANDDLPGQAGYGWKYYSDGVAIAPDGTYYKDGVVAWSASNQDSFPINDPNAYSVDVISAGNWGDGA